LPTSPAQSANLPRLYTEEGVWAQWFQKAGLGRLPKPVGARFNDASMNLQLAIAGEGIVLTRESLVALDVAEGKLVRRFDIAIDSALSCHLGWPEHREPMQKFVIFAPGR
jgi:LysR family glycine cleavage system transcriptional activator